MPRESWCDNLEGEGARAGISRRISVRGLRPLQPTSGISLPSPLKITGKLFFPLTEKLQQETALHLFSFCGAENYLTRTFDSRAGCLKKGDIKIG
ncbi:hypothetical protein J4Q44_G00350200 [Coregonus suidteri]|uniref:Uncharacterized protein n=1 Tax=Coregonus suidteri TaxID=861788 RepID=A0AAN8KY77_9TELE